MKQFAIFAVPHVEGECLFEHIGDGRVSCLVCGRPLATKQVAPSRVHRDCIGPPVRPAAPAPRVRSGCRNGRCGVR